MRGVEIKTQALLMTFDRLTSLHLCRVNRLASPRCTARITVRTYSLRERSHYPLNISAIVSFLCLSSQNATPRHATSSTAHTALHTFQSVPFRTYTNSPLRPPNPRPHLPLINHHKRTPKHTNPKQKPLIYTLQQRDTAPGRPDRVPTHEILAFNVNRGSSNVEGDVREGGGVAVDDPGAVLLGGIGRGFGVFAVVAGGGVGGRGEPGGGEGAGDVGPDGAGVCWGGEGE